MNLHKAFCHLNRGACRCDSHTERRALHNGREIRGVDLEVGCRLLLDFEDNIAEGLNYLGQRAGLGLGELEFGVRGYSQIFAAADQHSATALAGADDVASGQSSAARNRARLGHAGFGHEYRAAGFRHGPTGRSRIGSAASHQRHREHCFTHNRHDMSPVIE